MFNRVFGFTFMLYETIFFLMLIGNFHFSICLLLSFLLRNPLYVVEIENMYRGNVELVILKYVLKWK